MKIGRLYNGYLPRGRGVYKTSIMMIFNKIHKKSLWWKNVFSFREVFQTFIILYILKMDILACTLHGKNLLQI